jgi:hypothetical protein
MLLHEYREAIANRTPDQLGKDKNDLAKRVTTIFADGGLDA